MDSCVAHPEKLPPITKYAWIGGAVVQHPAIRQHYLSRIQDESKLLKSNLPFLALLGADDTHIDGHKLGNFVRKTFQGSEVHVFEDCGHSPFYEKPEDVNKAILRFVSRVKPIQ
jgi:pimeloyl-ACP methyl ester carboxylesterase